MTSATDALARARAELAAAEEMGTFSSIDAAIAAVEQAEQAVVDEGNCPYCDRVGSNCVDEEDSAWEDHDDRFWWV